MTILVVGASGATGQLLVKQLLNRGLNVKVIVRSPDKLPEDIRTHSNVSVIHASVLDLSDAEMAQHVKGCDAVASCLGHNVSFKGYVRPPTQACDRYYPQIVQRHQSKQTRSACQVCAHEHRWQSATAIFQSGFRLARRALSGFFVYCCLRMWTTRRLRIICAPRVGQNDGVIEWAAVRPDNLIDEGEVTEYTVHASPTRSAIFDAGTTSRINVGNFMADLITDHDTWNKWKGQMPVIYNKASVVSETSCL